MRLTPQELDKLQLHQAGVLAQKRLARGLRLNHPEAVALIATQVLELIRDGRTVAELMQLGRTMLGRADVMDGVGELLHEVQVEGTFPDGSKLVTIHTPIAAEHGDLALALYGSFLPVPQRQPVTTRDDTPGAIETPAGDIELNAGRAEATLRVTNSGDRPVQVGSHYHFVETNRALVFNRAKAYGMRLDIPAGTAVRFEPGETKTVKLVQIAGAKVIQGGNNLATGAVDEQKRAAVGATAVGNGFGHQEDAP